MLCFPILNLTKESHLRNLRCEQNRGGKIGNVLILK